jgi:hypothetical protein
MPACLVAGIRACPHAGRGVDVPNPAIILSCQAVANMVGIERFVFLSRKECLSKKSFEGMKKATVVGRHFHEPKGSLTD